MGDLNERLSFYEIGASEQRAFGAVRRTLNRAINHALDRFYAKVGGTNQLGHFFSSPKQMESAKSAQRAHWMGAFTHGLNEDYHRRAINIGHVHARIGLEPQWYVGGYALVVEDIIWAMVAPGWRSLLPWRRALAAQLVAFSKVAFLDMDLALSAYGEANQRNIANVVDRLGSALEALAGKDLSVSVTGLPREYARVEADFNAAAAALRAVLSEVASSSSVISTGSGEISVAAGDLAQRTERQASSLQHTTEAMGSVAKIVETTASDVGQARDSIGSVYDQAQQGSEVVTRAVDAMAAIDKSATEISRITNVIDAIAFQTNLLALNAGVEAARAGDAGRGFAVVASEVRALAQRSAEAAKEIKDLISASLAHVTRGVALVDETGTSFRHITGGIAQLRETIEKIALLAKDQAQNSRQISDSMESMDRMTQQNAAMVEETNAAARSLADQASRLDTLVSAFELGGQGSGKSPAKRKTRLAA